MASHKKIAASVNNKLMTAIHGVKHGMYEYHDAKWQQEQMEIAIRNAEEALVTMRIAYSDMKQGTKAEDLDIEVDIF